MSLLPSCSVRKERQQFHSNPPFVIFGAPPISPHPRKYKQEKAFFVLEKLHRPEKDAVPTGMVVTNSME